LLHFQINVSFPGPTDVAPPDETYIKVKGKDKYLYRAVDSTGQTIDFLLTAKRNAAAAQRFFRKALNSPGNPVLRVNQRGQEPSVSSRGGSAEEGRHPSWDGEGV
jgi:transposase-like protein